MLVLVAIAATGIYLYRDSIARSVANSVLKDSDLAVIGLSIDSIGTENIYFDELVLELGSGTQIRVTGVALPIDARKSQARSLKVDEVELIPAGLSDEPVAIAAILASIFELPRIVPYSAVQIGRVTTEGMPPLRDVFWESSDTGQLLDLDIGTFSITAGITPADIDEHRITLTATTSDDEIAVAAALVIGRESSAFIVSGQSTTRVAPILPILHAVGMVPVNIKSLDTLLRGVVNTSIPDNPQETIRVEATLNSDGDMSLLYQIDEESQMLVEVLSHAPTITVVEFPSLDWRVQLESGDMSISTDSVQDFPLNVTSLDCQSGIKCSLQANVAASNFSLGGLTIGSAVITAPISVIVDQQTRVDFAGSLTAVFREVSNQQFAAASIELSKFSGASISVNDNGWSMDTDEVHFLIDGVHSQPGINGTLPLALCGVAISDSGDNITGTYSIDSAAARLTFADLSSPMPDAEGTWQLANEEFSATVTLSSADRSILARLELRHHLASSAGAIHVQEASLDFDTRNLALMMSPSPKAWDVNAGRASLRGDLAWLASGDSYQVTGRAQIDIDSLAGFKDDIAFTGLTSTLSAEIDTQTGHAFQPASLSLELLDVGLPLSEIVTEFQIGTDLSSVQVNSLSMLMLGGTVRTDPFNYSLEAEANAILLRLDAIQLALMKSLAEFDSIDIEGSVSGVLPISITGDRISIDRGRLASDDPGGSIRYRAGDADAGTDYSGLGIATRALSNFQFETLTSDVTYRENGDLILSMRLKGVNPDMDANQPVVLNLNVENNVPQMLRSLQATRTIEDIFENRMNRE